MTAVENNIAHVTDAVLLRGKGQGRTARAEKIDNRSIGLDIALAGDRLLDSASADILSGGVLMVDEAANTGFRKALEGLVS